MNGTREKRAPAQGETPTAAPQRTDVPSPAVSGERDCTQEIPQAQQNPAGMQRTGATVQQDSRGPERTGLLEAPPAARGLSAEETLLHLGHAPQTQEAPPAAGGKKRRLPRNLIVQLVLLLLFPITFGLVALAKRNPQVVEDVYSRVIYPILVQPISLLFGMIPFSFAELGLAILLVGGIYVLVRMVRNVVHTVKAKGRVCLLLTDYLTRIGALAAVVLFLFNALYGFNYYRQRLSQSLGIRTFQYTASTISDVCETIIAEANAAREATGLEDDEPFSLPYSRDDLDRELMAAYENLAAYNEVFAGHYGRPKPVFSSKPWTYTFVMGIYIPFTGEANYNTNIPDCEQPYTILHEMAHQRGIAREEEADFAAYLACRSSDSSYLKYSGALEALLEFLPTVYRLDNDRYEQIVSQLSEGVQRDILAVQDFWDSYRTGLADVSSSINNLYLQSNGQDLGVASYSMSVQLIMDYYTSLELSQN